MSIGSVLKRAADYVVQGVLLIYYFLYYLVKGREYDQQLCTDEKWTTTTVPGTATNVCCLHGVQTRPLGIGYSPAQAITPRGFEPVSGPQTTQRGWFHWLNPKNWYRALFKSDQSQFEQRPFAPPRQFKPYSGIGMPNGSSPEEYPKKESWMSRLIGYLPFFGRRKNEEFEQYESTRRVLRVVATAADGGQGPQGVYGIDHRPGDYIRELKHAVEPHYPITLSQDQSESPYRPTGTVRPSTGAFIPPPPSQIPVKIGQTTLKIHVEPKQTPFYTAPEIQREITWANNERMPPQPHVATTNQVQMQRQQLRKTTTPYATIPENRVYSPQPYETDDTQKNVKSIKRQWPPPSNATGVEIVKDLVFPTGSPGDLSSAVVTDGDTSYNYDAYRPVTSPRSIYEDKSRRDYASSQEYNAEYEGKESGAPAKYREFSQELNSKESAGKGVEMFLRRRQRVENVMKEEEEAATGPLSSSAQRMIPVAPPRKRISSNELADSVVGAASRKEPQWRASSEQGITPSQARSDASSIPRREHPVTENVLVTSSSPISPTSRSHDRHERFFSPTPFSRDSPSRDRLFTPPPLSHEPKVQQHAYRSMSVLGDRMEQKELIDWSKGPDTTTTVISATSPDATRTVKKSTYMASRGSHYSKTSTINALPRTWKSYSEAYGQR